MFSNVDQGAVSWLQPSGLVKPMLNPTKPWQKISIILNEVCMGLVKEYYKQIWRLKFNE